MLCKHFIQTAGVWGGTRTESDFVIDHNYNEVQEITEVFASFGLRGKCNAHSACRRTKAAKPWRNLN